MKICGKCGTDFPTVQVVNGEFRNLTNRKFCTTCSPYKQGNRRFQVRNVTGKPCAICGGPVRITDVSRKSKCYTCISRIRRYRHKQKAVEMLGGKCARCGWHGDIAAYEFHHPEGDKTFGVGVKSNSSFSAVLVAEILKCELLCANCHRIEHAGPRSPEFLLAVSIYQGKDLNVTAAGKRRPSGLQNH